MRSATASQISADARVETDQASRLYTRFARRHRVALQAIAAFATYQFVSVLFFGRALFGAFGSRYLGRETDPTVMMWLFEWWPHAIAHHLNVFLTDLVWAPVGFNLASMTSIPLLSVIAYPFTRTFGLVVAYNIVALAAPASAALCAYLLCRELTGKFWPSLFGGYVFGFSGYMLGQMLGHLCLVAVFAFPLAAYVVIARLRGKLGPFAFFAALTILLIAQFLVDLELFATGVLFGSAMLAAVIYYSAPAERPRYWAELPSIGASLLAALVVVSPYLYYFFAF